jgi:hypothetical protein
MANNSFMGFIFGIFLGSWTRPRVSAVFVSIFRVTTNAKTYAGYQILKEGSEGGRAGR